MDSYDIPPLELNDEGEMDINEPVDSVNSDDIVQSNVENVESCGSSPSLETRDECVEKVKPVGYWLLRAKYNQKLTEMPDLRKECTTFQLKNERKLEKMPDIKEAFNSSIMKRIENGNYVLMEDIVKEHPEFKDFQKIFSPLNFALKPGSQTTSCRPIVNSSFMPNGMGFSFNDCQFRGSSLNVNIQIITLRMRQYRHIQSSDLNNFYQTIKLSLQDSALNCVIWRESGFCSSGRLVVLCATCVNYGMRMSQNIANLARNKTSEMFVQPISEVAHDHVKHAQSDDVVVGHDNEEECERLKNIVDRGLQMGSFSWKPWVKSGSDIGVKTVGAEESIGCLGLTWHVQSDQWSLRLNLNISPKKRGARDANFDIKSVEDAERLFQVHGLTRRSALRLCHSVYDPIFLFVQIKVTFSLLYRQIVVTLPDLDWDSPIPVQFHNDWIFAIKLALECEKVKVPRFCLKDSTKLEAWLGIVVDGAELATLSCDKHDRLPFSVILGASRVFSVPQLMFYLLPLALRIL